MSTLYLDRKGLELRLDGAALALYENGNRARTVPLTLLDRVVIRAETGFSSGVLGALAEAGTAVTVLSGRQGRRLATVLGRPHNDARIRVLHHEVNQGKGAALRTGFREAAGAWVLVQDADMEYDPADYEKLLAPALAGEADVVYGSRFLDKSATEAHYLLHGLANRFLTGLSNLLTGLNLTDMETCYKLVPKHLLEQIVITENRFGFEPEITAKLARLRPKPRIREVAVSYKNRSYEEGKKIGWKDGISAIRCILKYSLGR